MSALSSVEIQSWLADLKPGDRVGVFEHYGRVFFQERTVVRRTPSGRIVVDSGSTFKPDGYLYGSSVYGHRCLRPVPAKVKNGH